MDSSTPQFLFQLVLSLALGAAVGYERETRGKSAGFRTYALVSMGACLFTILSVYGFTGPAAGRATDLSRVASQVVVGIGFIGAGLILHKGESVEGLTTAAGLWISSAIGMAAGVRMYGVAVFATFLVIFVLRVLRWIEPYLRGAHENEQGT